MMFATVDKENRSMDLTWFTQQGTMETKRISMERYVSYEEATSNPMAYEYKLVMDTPDYMSGNWIYRPRDIYMLLEHLRGNAAFFPVYMAAVFGFTANEVLRLTWKNIDLKNDVLVIRSDTRIRMIRLSLQFRDIFFDMRGWQEAKFGVNRDDSRPICLREDGCVFEADELCKRLRIATDKAELPSLDFDELRFSSAMMLLQQGYNITEIWGWLGQQNCWFDSQPLSNCHWVENT